MKLKLELPLALKSFFKGVGVPPKIICDGALEQMKGNRAVYARSVIAI